MKTQHKITLFLTVIFLAYTLLFSGFIYFFTTKYSFADFYKRLELRAITTAKIKLEPEEIIAGLDKIKEEFLERLPNEKDIILSAEPKDSLFIKAKEFGLSKSFVEEVLTNKLANYNSQNTFYAAIKYTNTFGEEYIVIASAENYFNSHHIAYLKNLLIISFIVAFILVVVISLMISKRLVQPVRDITKKVKEIGTDNLHLRITETKQQDELSTLVETFNDMLDRLETSFETQKNFISNASHELNTPLTSIIGEADVTLSKIRTTEEYIEALQTILEEAEKLDKKTKALLFLAQTGYSGKTLSFDKVRIDQLLIDVKETMDKIYPKNNVVLDFSLLPEDPLKLKVKGNQQLMHLALSNIIMNACKYSDNKEVQVSLSASNENVIIVVKDQGIGIPEEELQYIYDPFFRASNTKNYDGYGIGLPLTRNVIKIHHGEILVSSSKNKGTTVQIKIPLGYYSF